MKTKVIKRERCLELQKKPLHNDLRRLIRSTAVVLRREYPNEIDRRVTEMRVINKLKEELA